MPRSWDVLHIFFEPTYQYNLDSTYATRSDGARCSPASSTLLTQFHYRHRSSCMMVFLIGRDGGGERKRKRKADKICIDEIMERTPWLVVSFFTPSATNLIVTLAHMSYHFIQLLYQEVNRFFADVPHRNSLNSVCHSFI